VEAAGHPERQTCEEEMNSTLHIARRHSQGRLPIPCTVDAIQCDMVSCMQPNEANTPPLLEICVDSLGAAQAAARGGADRIEVCGELSGGGVTPSLGLLEAVLESVRIPVHCMIRPRAGDFRYADDELRAMERDIALAKAGGAAGVVFGVLTRDGAVDVGATSRLVQAARPMRVTFHRAFDVALCAGGDPETTLEHVIQAGSDILLTSGGAPRVTEGSSTVARLVARSSGRIEIMAGSGVRLNNAAAVWEMTQADTLHASLRRPLSAQEAGHLLPDAPPVYEVREDDVRTLAATLQQCHLRRQQRLS
jgi:copper homeostasis protein